MGWRSEEFGASHEGNAQAVLADGSEPGPRYFDVGSGPNVHKTSDWWVYDGTPRAPQATDLRAACVCGWRGLAQYVIDWSDVERNGPDLYDTSGPYGDWNQHIREVTARTVPLPAAVEDLLERLDEQLTALAMDAPLAALRAVAALERTTRSVGRAAACMAEADEMPWEAIGTALGLSERDACARLRRYSLGLDHRM
ncbi:hypothetical protein AB0G73_16520 [Streptomyces sp. NPDC020719]|uniref:hypothetical protein n=1 Tax=Streptomyces sp. NPDC020719 TaxID=3154896 RepID=UPI0033CB66AC